MIERAADRAVNLRHATQTVGVLDSRIVRQMRLPDLAVTQKMAKTLGYGALTRMRSGGVDSRIESGRRSLERFQRHRASDVGHASEPLRPKQRKAADCMHRLGAVEKGEAFLRFELHWFQPRFLQGIGSWHSLALVENFAFSNQGQRQMRERREITACSHRTFLRDHRHDLSIIELAKLLDDFQANSAKSERENIC